MEFLHQSHYGHLGEMHTARPTMVKVGSSIYATNAHQESLAPRGPALYTVKDNLVYSTEHSPEGRNPHAVFEIRGDKIHTTIHNVSHDPSNHVFELKPHP